MSDENRHNRELADLLQAYPLPKGSADYYAEALNRAARTGVRRRRNRWMMTGFGSAIAAGLAIWIMSGLLLTAPNVPNVESGMPGVSIALEQPKTVNLVFASAAALDDAVVTLTLPDGIELDGFPGRRQISWETSLVAGKNRLPLRLIARSAQGGELTARLEHNDRDKEFRLRVDVS